MADPGWSLLERRRGPRRGKESARPDARSATVGQQHVPEVTEHAPEGKQRTPGGK